MSRRGSACAAIHLSHGVAPNIRKIAAIIVAILHIFVIIVPICEKLGMLVLTGENRQLEISTRYFLSNRNLQTAVRK